MNLTFRHETPADYQTVEEMTRAAFWNLHVPGCDEHYLVHVLRKHPDYLPELSYLAVVDGEIAGHIMFARAQVEEIPVVGFGPLTVHPKYQRQGIGKALIAHARTKAAELGYRAILIYGFPKNYLNRGFVPASQYRITNSEGMYLPALMALELIPGGLRGVSGRFFESKGYHLNPEDARTFDSNLPAWEKVFNLPGHDEFTHESALTTSPAATALAALESFLTDEHDELTVLSVIPSILNFYLPTLNWAGFYLLRGDELVVGPFQGLPPCTRIPMGKGVCGAAAVDRVSKRVDDVHTFPGHIACDSASQSELVIPIFRRGEVYGVLDLDSPIHARFTETDEVLLTQAMEALGAWLSAGLQPSD